MARPGVAIVPLAQPGRRRARASRRQRNVPAPAFVASRALAARNRARGPTQRRRRRPQGPRRSNGTFGGAMGPERDEVAPASVGVNFGASYIRKNAGRVQRMADYGPEEGSERVSFCDIFGSTITAGSSTVAAGFGGTGIYYKNLTPTNVSPRLSQYEEMYQFYAFRKLLIEYLPTTGSNTAVGVNIGFDQSANDLNNIAAPTVQQIMEFRPSMGGQAWQVMRMVYTHTGSKLWTTTSTGGGEANTNIQGALAAVLDGTPVASTGYGKLRISGIIDFYRDTPPSSTAPSIRLNKILNQITPEQRFELLAEFNKRAELEKAQEASEHKDSVIIDEKTSNTHHIGNVQLCLDEEFQQFLKYREYQIKQKSEIKQAEVEIEDDFDSIPSTTISNNSVKLNPLALEFKQGAKAHTQSVAPASGLPKSESFMNQVMDLVAARSNK